MMEHMFETDDHTSESGPAGPPTDDDVEAVVARLVAAFGGGELMTVRPRDRHPLSAA